MLVRARLGDVVADGVGLAGVGDTAGTALALGHHGKLAVHRRARQGPAVHLPLLRSQVGDTETKDRGEILIHLPARRVRMLESPPPPPRHERKSR